MDFIYVNLVYLVIMNQLMTKEVVVSIGKELGEELLKKIIKLAEKLKKLFVKKGNILCNCSNSLVTNFYNYEVPLKGGRYTSFFAGKCKKCGGWNALPRYNFKLAIMEGTEKAHNFLIKHGIPVDELREEIELKRSLK